MIARDVRTANPSTSPRARDSVMKFSLALYDSQGGIIPGHQAMALELAGHRIRVNALAPGLHDTENEILICRCPRRETDNTYSAAPVGVEIRF